MQRTILQIPLDPSLEDYILSIVEATRNDGRLQLGASPRASIALYKGAQALASIRGNSEATIEDIRELATPVLLKRIQVKSEHLLKGITEEAIIAEILQRADAQVEAQAG